MVAAGADADLILLGEVTDHRLDVGGLHGVHLVAGEHILKPRLLQRPAQNLRHIVAAGVVILIADAVGVGKVGVGKTKLLHLCIHGRHAVRDGAAAKILCQQVGTIVGAGHLGSVQRIHQGDFFPFPQGDMTGIRARQ